MVAAAERPGGPRGRQPAQCVVEQLDGVERGQGPVVHVAGYETTSTASLRTTSTRWSRKAAWAPTAPTRWNERPRCQSEVCRILTRATLGTVTDNADDPDGVACAVRVGAPASVARLIR